MVSDTDLMAVYSAFKDANGLDTVIDAAEILHRVLEHQVHMIGQGGQKHTCFIEWCGRLSNVIFLDPMEKRSLFGMLKTADVDFRS